MSTGGQKQQGGVEPEVQKINDWNNRFFQLDRRMARKLRFEQDELLKRKPRAKPRVLPNTPPTYRTLESWTTEIEDVQKLSSDKREAAYDQISNAIRSAYSLLSVDKNLDTEGKKPHQAVLTGAAQKLKIAREQDKPPKTQTVPQQPPPKTPPQKPQIDPQVLQKIKQRKTQQLQKADEINKTAARLKPMDFMKGLEGQFSVDKVKAIVQLTKAEDSEFKNVVIAMDEVRNKQADLRKGAGTYKDFTTASMNLLETARNYIATHKDPKSKDGIERVKQANIAIQGMQSIQHLVEAENKEIAKVCEEVEKLTPEQSSLKAIEPLEGFLKFPYLGSEYRQRIEKAIAKVQGQQQTVLNGVLKDQGIDKPTDTQLVESLLTIPGTCKPPKKKGQSDSFFINGTDGKPKFIMKPVNGESRFSDAWPEGGGAPRELIVSKFSENIGSKIGLDFGVPKTIGVSLEDDSFTQGTKSKDRKRVGALQETVKVGDPADAYGFFENATGKVKSTDVRQLMEALNEDDAQNIAMMDFIMLNGDRQPDNVLLRDPVSNGKGQTRLAPIDAGQALPTVEAFRRGCLSMSSNTPYDPNTPTNLNDNLLMQLPVAQKKFSQKQLDALNKLDPEEMVKQMKADATEVGKQFPEMKDKVSDESFDLARKSAHFLKAAAKELTMYQISQVYASGFEGIINASNDTELTKAIKDAIAACKEFQDLGGNAEYAKLGIPPGLPLQQPELVSIIKQAGGDPNNAKVAHANVLIKRLDGIEPYLADSAKADVEFVANVKKMKITDPSEVTAQLMDGINDVLIYKASGGDPMFRMALNGNAQAYQEFVGRTLHKKGESFTLNTAKEFMRMGGYAKLKQLMGNDYNAFANQPFEKHASKLEQLMKA